MNIKLKILSTLIYYDVPHLFIARDMVGTNYLCLLIDDSDEQHKYIAVAISPDKLNKVINGLLDLRSIFESPELGTWYVLQEFDDEFGYAIKSDLSTLPEEYLPNPGFAIPKTNIEEQLIVSEAFQKDNTIVHLSLADFNDAHSIPALRCQPQRSIAHNTAQPHVCQCPRCLACQA